MFDYDNMHYFAVGFNQYASTGMVLCVTWNFRSDYLRKSGN